jgi:hypothetical protein
MSILNKDILFLIFEELQDDSKSLFSCLMVNRCWCDTVIPVLWRNPWCYSNINYSNKSYLFIIIACYLFDDIKEFITNQTIRLPLGSKQPLLFDYLSFCRSINVEIINSIISVGSSLAYNQFCMQQEFYYLFMRKCQDLRYFDMKSIKHQIFHFPEANTRLESLCELKCDTSIDSSYFYGLSRSCQHIQRLVIVNIYTKLNHGIIKLIEVQKNLKYFKWSDEFDNYPEEDPYREILLALEKKADSLDHLIILSYEYAKDFDDTFLQKILPKFHKLKTLAIDCFPYFTDEQVKILAYQYLEILNIELISLNGISSVIKNSGGRLKKILFRPHNIHDIEFDGINFNENSLDFIRKIYENCPSIEYLSIAFFPSKEHFSEFEKLLKICKNLKSLLLVILNLDIEMETIEKMKNGEILLQILIKSAPTNLKEIRFFDDDFKFSLENLEEFFESWRGRTALSILTSDSLYEREDYKKLIDKYKNDGIIKDFRYVFCYRVNYDFEIYNIYA